MKKALQLTFLALGAAACLGSAVAQTAASGPAISQGEARDLKTQSDAQFKARKKVSEANEDLNVGDCKTALDGSAKRACEKSAKQHARAAKADAKTLHESEVQTIDNAKK